ncbi:UNVERIFIED_CONTAM: hypothetical protein GTU68_040036 [Idotea baltica]|nr:hypothetical protein [Idotea baltica]
MKITNIKAYQVDLPLKEGSYHWSGGKSVAVFDSTVVRIETDAGIVGWGEVCPLGPAYLAAYANGVRTGIKELAPLLIGQNPLETTKLNRLMDAAMKGHPYVKSAIDMACWDILGKRADLPVCVLLGGRYGDDVILYRAISQGSPQEMMDSVNKYKEEGYTRFQLKVGADAQTDIERIRACRGTLESTDRLIADANTGWNSHDALRVANGVRDLDVYIEQPCPTYEECLRVREHTTLPFILDEVIDGIDILNRATSDRRDLCVSLGIVRLLRQLGR